jgi:hypothetical protein
MEGELFNRVYALLMRMDKYAGPAGCVYSDRWIVLTYLWAVIHDRPRGWACHPGNAWMAQRNLPLPSESTLSRRLRSPSVRQCLQDLQQHLKDAWPTGNLWFIDAKPLPIGSCSKDPDAGYGRAGSGKAKGYKLYAIRAADGPIHAWRVHPMQASEVTVAIDLIRQVDGPGVLVGDREYDVGHLYDRSAAQGLQLLAPKVRGEGLGHRPQSPHRLAGLTLAGTPQGQGCLRRRIGIDQYFGQLGNSGGGLSPLPNWVRRRHRVELWVQAKLILHLVRLTIRSALTA